MKVKGSVTIFLGLSISFFIILIEVLAKGCIINAERERFEVSADIAMNSVLGEFNKTLYSKYDVLYIDASYLGKTPKIENVKDRILMYMRENTENVLNVPGGPWGNINLSSVNIERFQGACANSGMSFRNQANIYVEDKADLNSLLGMVKGVEEKKDGIESARNENVLEDWANLMEMISGKELPKKVNPVTGEIEIVELDNPADSYFSQSRSDIFSLVNVSMPQSVSFNTDTLISNRGAINTELLGNTNNSKDIFITYLVDRMSCYLRPKGHLLSCELEYIIHSSNSDYENFKYVINEIYKIQLAENYRHVSTDGYYISKAYAEAEALEVSTLDPTFIEPVANSILYAYAFIEALKDMNSILGGGEGDDGLNYEQYLIAMMFMEDDSRLNYKGMDLVELEVRRLDMNQSFSMDWCIERIDFLMKAKGSGPEEIVRRRMYGYY